VLRDRVARVQDEIDEHLLDLSEIGVGPGDGRTEARRQLDPRAIRGRRTASVISTVSFTSMARVWSTSCG
jgi:hypothetical protein